MGSTKIINVLKNDSFEEVFDLFRSTDASDIVFIIPRSARITKEKYFSELEREGRLTEKRIGMLTNDPVAVDLAGQFNFDLLGSGTAGIAKSTAVQTVDDDVTDDPDFVDSENPLEPENDPESEDSPEDNTDINENREGLNSDGGEEEAVNRNLSDDRFKSEEEGDREETQEPADKGSDEEETSSPAEGRGENWEELSEIPPEKESYPESLPLRPAASLAAARMSRSRVSPEVPGGKKIKRQEIDDKIAEIWKHPGRQAVTGFRRQGGSKKKIWQNKKYIIITVAAMAIGLGIIFGYAGSAKIVITPVKNEISFQLKITSSTAIATVDHELNNIPGQKFSENIEKSKIFPTTGEKEVVRKASGTIEIRNRSFTSQKLVATTRFENPEGLIFRIPNSVIVPAARKSGTEIIEGAIESEVYADKPGPEYNISPAQFTIPGFEGSAKFNEFYGVSKQSMAGGMAGLSKVVTEQDFVKAESELKEEAELEIIKRMKSKIGDLKVIEPLITGMGEAVSNAKAGDPAENLEMTLKGSATTIAFRETDIIEIAKRFVAKNGGLDLLTKGLNLEYKNPELDKDGLRISFDVQIKGLVAAKIDTEKIRQDVFGMDEPAIRSYFSDNDNISSVRVYMSPFWIGKVPRQNDRVKIEINLE